MNEAKWDSSGQRSWVGTPVIERTFFFLIEKNRTIHTEETLIRYKKYDVSKSNKKEM